MDGVAETGRRWWALMAAAVGLHAVLSLLFPNAPWTTSVGVGVGLLVPFSLCLAMARRAGPAMRWRWLTLAAALAVWLSAFAAIVYALVTEQDVSRALLFGLLFAFRGVPFLLLLARSGDTDDGRLFFRIDSAQALLFAALAILLLFPEVLTWGGPAEPFVSGAVAMGYHDIQNFGLALLSVLGLLGQPAGERRHFARALCVLLVIYAPDAWFVNNVLLGALPPPPPGSINNILIDIPTAAFVVMATRPVRRDQRSIDRPSARIFRVLLPVGFCAASLAASFAVGGRYPAIGIAGATVGLALYALRSAIMQLQLRQAQQLVAEVIERLPDALCVVGPDGIVTLGNDEASRLFAVDVHGVPFAGLLERLGPPDDGGEVQTADGRTWVIAQAILADGSRIVRLTDITGIRGAERDREEALQFLSHDMRSPNAAIVTLLEGHDLSAGGADVLGRIRRYARHGLGMADDFVRLARLRTATAAAAPVDLADAAAEAADMLWAAARERRITLHGDIDSETWVTGDRGLLVRAIHNLLDNGVKFAPEGAAVRYAVAAEGGAATVRVSGPGPEIPPERMANLFEPFGAGRHAGGLDSVGLGLAFVHAAVRRMGGAVRYEPAADGHMFVIELPLLQEEDETL